jgi:hypothetical protein
MKAALELQVDRGITLRDAIAYEFYMENVTLLVNDYEGLDLNKDIQDLAIDSYLLADIFIDASDHTFEQNTNESSTQES